MRAPLIRLSCLLSLLVASSASAVTRKDDGFLSEDAVGVTPYERSSTTW
jgi:hypothetical protein